MWQARLISLLPSLLISSFCCNPDVTSILCPHASWSLGVLEPALSDWKTVLTQKHQSYQQRLTWRPSPSGFRSLPNYCETTYRRSRCRDTRTTSRTGQHVLSRLLFGDPSNTCITDGIIKEVSLTNSELHGWVMRQSLRREKKGAA